MELNDIYDRERKITGRTHRRGTPWKAGEYGLVVCVWVYDDAGRVLLTRRAPGKTFAGTWENSGGAAQAGETGLQAIRRELFEETGICAAEEEFHLLTQETERYTHYDFYCLHKNVPIEEVVLQPGETDNARWVSVEEVYQMIADKQICKIIARQFRKQVPMLLQVQSAQ